MDFARVDPTNPDQFTLRQLDAHGWRWLGLGLAGFVAYDLFWRTPSPQASLATHLLCDAFLALTAFGLCTFRRSASVGRDGIVRATWKVPGFRISSLIRLTPRAVLIERGFVHGGNTVYGVRHDILYVLGEFDRRARVAHCRDEAEARALGQELAEFLNVPLEDQTLRTARIPNVAFGLHKEARW